MIRNGFFHFRLHDQGRSVWWDDIGKEILMEWGRVPWKYLEEDHCGHRASANDPEWQFAAVKMSIWLE